MDDNTSDVYEAIFEFFGNKFLSAEECLEQTRSILNKNRDVVHEQDADGRTLLHYAAAYAWSPEYCKLILEFDPTHESLQLLDSDGWPPFHFACREGNLATARYLLEMHPESINVTDDEDGYNCLHILLHFRVSHVEDNKIIEFIEFLLERAPGLISSSTTEGDLPLHIACCDGFRFSVVKFLYNAHPEAIYRRNNAANTPLDEAFYSGMFNLAEEQDEVISFFVDQLALANAAETVRTPDTIGRLPIHRAMFNVNLPVGTVKLMIHANPDSALVADLLGQTPLHVACQHCNMDVIKHLVDANQHSLLIPDSSGDLPLHIACRYGMFDGIEWILDRAGGGVSIENYNGKLPIEMLLYEANCDRNSLEYVQAVYALLRSHPESVTLLA
jgi:ankyrin repeat protein